jgi:hypothetical protein
MKVSDLRVGNIVMDFFDIKNPRQTIIQLEDFAAMLNYRNSNHPNYYKPIPFNEEWKGRLGIAGDPVMITNSDGDSFYLSDFKFKYVHELQNLWFSIKGVELSLS